MMFVVPGRAQPAGSKRAFIRNGKAVVVDANPASGAWKERVALVAASAYGASPPIVGPVTLEVVVTMLRPQSDWLRSGALSKSARPHPTIRPDLLKLARAVEDALTGIVYVDDAQIVLEVLRKEYGARDEVTVRVERMQGAS